MVSNNNELEKRLWGTADQLRANSGLKASEYSTPVLGLIFLRVTIKNILEGLPEIYNEDIYNQKVQIVYQHVYESYYGSGQSVYENVRKSTWIRKKLRIGM